MNLKLLILTVSTAVLGVLYRCNYGIFTNVKNVILESAQKVFSMYNEEYKKNVAYVQNSDEKSTKNLQLFQADELKLYNGMDKPELYLAILGNVFDVSKGAKYYGPGESYYIFVGRDASRSFITGKFTVKDATDDVIGVSQQDLRALNNWLKFYHKEYTIKGKLIGRYYDKNGKLTPYGKEIKRLIAESLKVEADEALEKLKLPPCNIEWDAQKGTRVWCTRKSGGIERSWVGVPRQLFEIGTENYRCACVSEENLHLGNLREYVGCDSKSESCFVIS